MAHQALGHHAEAKRWLEKLRAGRLGTNPADFWEEAEIRVRLREVEALIAEDARFPADPFRRDDLSAPDPATGRKP